MKAFQGLFGVTCLLLLLVATSWLPFVPVAHAQAAPACSLTTAGDGLPDTWGADLRLLFFGIDDSAYDEATAPANPVAADCDSQARRDLVSNCDLYHVYRPADDSPENVEFKSSLQVPAEQPYCNAPGVNSPGSDLSDKTDADPIRVACSNGEDVCGCDGTLGLILPIEVPTSTGTPQIYPQGRCTDLYGHIDFPLNTEDDPVAPNPSLGGWCPDGSEKVNDGCALPKRSADNWRCMYWNVDQPGVPLALDRRAGTLGNPACPDADGPNDVRSFNLTVRNGTGKIAAGADGVDWEGHAFYRIHMLAGATKQAGDPECQELDSNDQINCLVQRDRAAGLYSVGLIPDATCGVAFDDGNPCTVLGCTTGGALNPPIAMGTSCTDGDVCNGSEVCDGSGLCLAGTPPETDDDNECTLDYCEPLTGVVHDPLVGMECEIDICTPAACDEEGLCSPTGEILGDDGDPCTIETCNLIDGVVQRACDPVDATVASNVHETTTWLYTGTDPVQAGVDPEQIEFHRATVIHGRVEGRKGYPISGAVVTVEDHPEFGETTTQTDGTYEMVVNGGGAMVLEFVKHPDYLEAQRQVNVPWAETTEVPPVVMVRHDTLVAEVDLTDLSNDFQVAEGSEVTDDDGVRTAKLLVPAGVEAWMDGQPVDELSIRATEFTVGQNGPDAMPGALPPTSGYTYAIEFNADQAVAAGAEEIVFSEPLPAYVSNFLAFPSGTIVPLGAYDKRRGEWVPEESGIVLDIVSIDASGAHVDLDDDGVAETTTELETTFAAYEFTPEELLKMGELYDVGESLWRVRIPHFTQPYDCNWPVGPPDDAEPPPPGPPPDPDDDDDQPDSCDEVEGSIIACHSMTLRESVPVAGTPFSLNYSSLRVPDRPGASLTINLSDSTVPPSLQGIEIAIEVGGRDFDEEFPPLPDQEYVFEWDGLDAFGRRLQGAQPATVTLGYVYGGVYETAGSFADYGSGVAVGGDEARGRIVLTRRFETLIGSWDARDLGLGGWTLSPNHVYEPVSGRLNLGTGAQRKAALEANVLTEVHTAPEISLTEVGPDGSLYYVATSAHRVHRVDPEGVLHPVAGTGIGGYDGDGGPATAARLNRPADTALGRDGTIYIADDLNHVVRAVDPDGDIRTFAGNGDIDDYGDGGPAVDAALRSPSSVAVGPDGSVYIGDESSRVIRRVAPGGIISWVAGNGAVPTEGNVGTAIIPSDLAVAGDGTLYVASSGTTGRGLFEVSPFGDLNRIARYRPGTHGFRDGMIAINNNPPPEPADLWNISTVSVGPEDALYFDANFTHTDSISEPARDAVFALVGGHVYRGGFGGLADYYAGAPATQVRTPTGGGSTTIRVAYGPAGLFVSANGGGDDRIIKVGRGLPSLKAGVEGRIASPDSDEIFLFDPSGRHTQTVHALTGEVLHSFSYDGAGLLVQIMDGDGKTTTIDRDGSEITLTGPYGHETVLTLDANGFVSSVDQPIGEVQITSSAGGLIEAFTDARGQTSTMQYDERGRLTSQERPNTGTQDLTLVSAEDPNVVEFESAEGRTTRYTLTKVGTTTTRVIEYPDGTSSTHEFAFNAATTTVTTRDGTTIESTTIPDPRFGVSRPLTKTITTPPSGLVSQVMEATRTVTLADPFDPFSLQEESTTRTVNGKAHLSVYNASTLTRSTWSPQNRFTQTTYDARGRVVQQFTNGLFPIDFTYDADGRLESIEQGMRVTQLQYFDSAGPENGYLWKHVDALNQTTTFTRDAFGRTLTETYEDSSTTAFGWDEGGNLTSVTPPGQPSHAQAYDSMAQLASYEPPIVAGVPDPNTSYDYNLDKQMLSEVRPDGSILEWTYDTAGRIDTLEFPTGTLDYDYDPATGQLTTIAGPDGESVALTYDGQLQTSTTWSGDVSGSIDWVYNDDFLPVSETVSGDTTSSTATFGYDDDNLMTCASRTTCLPPSADALQITYDGSGLMAEASLGNLSETYTYNDYGELATHTVVYDDGTPETIFSMVYDDSATTNVAPRDDLGRIVRRTETVLGTSRELDYSYDQRGRLIGVAEGLTVLSEYDHDDNGNRLSHTTPGGTVAGTHDDQDRLLSYGDFTFTYGENGELETKTDTVTSDVTTYVYDARGSLRSVTLPDTTVIEYVIDGQARRVGKRVGGALVQGFLYKDQLRIAAELDGAGEVVSHFSYVGGSHSPDWMTKGGALYRFVKDQVGSVRLVVDALTGDVAQEMEYDEFGAVLSDSNPGFQPFGFAGGLYDGDTGLTRFGARDYDAGVGRWTSKDPIRWEGGQANLLSYAGVDPVNKFDPSGEIPSPTCGVIASFCFGFTVGTEIAEFIDAYFTCREKADEAQRRIDEDCGPEDSQQANREKSDAFWECVGNAGGFDIQDAMSGACAIATIRVCL